MLFNMSYENAAGKLIIADTESRGVVTNFTGYNSFKNNFSGLRLHKHQTDKIFAVAERVNHLLNTGRLADSVLMYSYTGLKGNAGVFTPYICLKRQYCLGLMLGSNHLSVVTYGEILGDCIAVKRKECDRHLFWELIERHQKHLDDKEILATKGGDEPSHSSVNPSVMG